MGILIWIGTAITLAGVAGLMWCSVQAARAKSSGLDDAGLKDRLARLVPINLAALMVSAFGLIVVIAGLFLQ